MNSPGRSGLMAWSPVTAAQRTSGRAASKPRATPVMTDFIDLERQFHELADQELDDPEKLHHSLP